MPNTEDRLYRYLVEKQKETDAKVSDLRSKKEEAEEKECTFRPKTLNPSAV